jgi:hypothetical protein
MLERLRLLRLKSVGLQRGLMAVALCMLLLQSVVGMHRVLHLQNASMPSVATQLSDNTTVGAETDRSASSDCNKPSLWGDHTRAADCQLFDQACADASPAAMWLAPSVAPLPSFVAQTLLSSWVERSVYFSARGPPVVC